jgi:osmotically-inducible protein OsmY
MKAATSLIAVATAAILTILPMQQAFCQDSAAGREMQQSGQSMKSGEVGDSAGHLYHGAVDQMSDATLTTKVKSALLTNDRTRKYSIHVESDHGKVTIDGAVGSRSSAKYVQTVVAAVEGVRTVDNKLTWPTS